MKAFYLSVLLIGLVPLYMHQQRQVVLEQVASIPLFDQYHSQGDLSQDLHVHRARDQRQDPVMICELLCKAAVEVALRDP